MGFIYHGTYDYYWKVDTAKLTGTVAAQPDLIVQDIWTTPDPPVAGQSVTIHATLCNIGSAGTGIVSIPLDYYSDGSYIGSDSLSLGLTAGECNEESISYTLDSCGSHQVCVIIDPGGIIPESSDSNNQRCESYSWTCPDLLGWDCYAPSSAHWGDTIEVDYQIRNQRNAGSGAFKVLWSLDTNSSGGGTYYDFGYTQEDGIAASSYGPDKTVYLPLPSSPPAGFSPSGTYYIQMYSDIADDVLESDETNNYRAAQYYDYDTIVLSMPFIPPTLVEANCYVTPSTVDRGANLTFHYRIQDNNSGSIVVGLGASIRLHSGGSWESDVSCDTYVTAPAGSSDHTRCFHVDADEPYGSYDAAFGLWETIGTGSQWDYFELANAFTVADLTGPTNPGTPYMYASSDSGQYDYDRLTNVDKPTFGWSASSDSGSGVDGYRVSYIDSTPDSDDYWTDTNSWAPGFWDSAIPDGTQTLYIRAFDNAGNPSAGVSSVGFTVDTQAPPPPTLAWPGEWEQVEDTTPTLQWTQSDVWKWQVYVREHGFPWLDDRTSPEVTVSQWTVAPSLDHKAWGWQVKAWDIAGNEGAYGRSGQPDEWGHFEVAMPEAVVSPDTLLYDCSSRGRGDLPGRGGSAVDRSGGCSSMRVGERLPVNIDTPRHYEGVTAGDRAETRWQYNLSHPGATYLVVHFREFDLALGDYLVVRDSRGDVQYILGERGKMGAGAFWSQHIKDDSITLEFVVRSYTGGEGFQIDEYAAGFARLEQPRDTREICGSDDKANAVCYQSSHPTEYDRGRAVARLLINGTDLCTGWLVSETSMLLTNEHCITTNDDALNTDYEFMAEAPNCGDQNCQMCFPGVVFSGGTLVQDSWDLDYALVHVNSGVPADAYGFLEIDDRVATVGERIYIPQHPGGRAKEFAIFSTDPQDAGGVCRVFSTDRPGCDGRPGPDVGYYADTEGGSSGSPVLAHSSNRVIALHHCGDCPNRAVPINAIHDEIGAFFNACFVVRNEGDGILEVTSITGLPWWGSVNPQTPYNIGAGAAQLVCVDVNCGVCSGSDLQATLQVHTNDPDSPTMNVSLSVDCPTPPVADFTGSPRSGQAPLTVQFTDQTNGEVTSWAWDFDNNGSTDSTAENPSWTYNNPGTYSVKLTVTGPGGSDYELKTNYITVGYPPPVAGFTGSPRSGQAPLTVQFTDQSGGEITSWAWDFDNNGTTDSTTPSPSHTYNNPGTYSVKLTVTGPGGSDFELKPNYITVGYPAPTAAFTASPRSGTAPLTVQFTDESGGEITSWAWDFDNNGTTDSTAPSPSHTYNNPGTYSVKLTVTGPGGSDFELKLNYISVGEHPPVLISGGIHTAAGMPIEGVVISFTGQGDATTLADGSYSKSVPYGWTGTATPCRDGWGFDLPEHSYPDPLYENKSGEDFAGTLVYDIDPLDGGDDTIGVGDFSRFAPAWQQAVPPAPTYCDFDCDGFVGVGDFSYFAPAWLKGVFDPAIQFPPCCLCGDKGDLRQAESQVVLQLVAVLQPTADDEVPELPASIPTAQVGSTYWLEVWARESGDTATGLSSVYVDVSVPPSLSQVGSVQTSARFPLFVSGSMIVGQIDEAGGSTMDGQVATTAWVRLATARVQAISVGTASYEIQPSTIGIATHGRGAVAAENVQMNGVAVIHALLKPTPIEYRR